MTNTFSREQMSQFQTTTDSSWQSKLAAWLRGIIIHCLINSKKIELLLLETTFPSNYVLRRPSGQKLCTGKFQASNTCYYQSNCSTILPLSLRGKITQWRPSSYDDHMDTQKLYKCHLKWSTLSGTYTFLIQDHLCFFKH